MAGAVQMNGSGPADTSVAAFRSGRGRRRASGRHRVLDTPTVLAEDLWCEARSGRTPEDFSPRFQVCLPYRGLFVWHVGGDAVFADANQVLFVAGGQSYTVEQPVPASYAELVITPDVDTLAALAGVSDARLAEHALFRRRSRRASFALQHARSTFLRMSSAGGAGRLAAEETVLDLIRAAISDPTPQPVVSGRTRRLIGRTKEYLEAHLAEPIRLVDVARAVGASPAYLTEAFRRAEGVPLHKYLVQLRLARALTDLPHVTDLTALALDLGFSSHSHFTAAFRRAYGLTPSAFRDGGRIPQERRA